VLARSRVADHVAEIELDEALPGWAGGVRQQPAWCGLALPPPAKKVAQKKVAAWLMMNFSTS
jgi:hypothetical protein